MGYVKVRLGELIEALESAPQDLWIVDGFGEADSYRGDYAELRFEPKSPALVSDMLADARKAVGATYTGYKGGEYTMGLGTPVNIAGYGECMDESLYVTRDRLVAMLANRKHACPDCKCGLGK